MLLRYRSQATQCPALHMWQRHCWTCQLSPQKWSMAEGSVATVVTPQADALQARVRSGLEYQRNISSEASPESLSHVQSLAGASMSGLLGEVRGQALLNSATKAQ